MKKRIKSLITFIIRVIILPLLNSRIGYIINDIIIEHIMNRKLEINYNGIKMKFITPNRLNKYRITTFSTKEPETLDWIDNFEVNSIFWDIGANIGLYSCYAAMKKSSTVYSFEPSVFNLELLARNIYVNNLTNNISIVPIALTEKLSLNKLNMITTSWGGALSSFGKQYTHDGSNINKTFEFSTIGINMDNIVSLLKIPYPHYVKIDVDGIEHLILRGGLKSFQKTRSLLIEIDEKFIKQELECTNYLKQIGFVMKGKYRSSIYDNTHLSSSFNQIWVRS